MKPIAIFSPVILGLTLLPTAASANLTTPSSLSSLNQEQFNKLGNFQIAQRYLSYQDVISRLYNSEPKILGIVRKDSKDNKRPVRWDYISVESINDQLIKLNVHGKIKKPGKPHLRVGLKLQRNSQYGFKIVGYDWSAKGLVIGLPKYKKQIREALKKLPESFPRYQRELNSILA